MSPYRSLRTKRRLQSVAYGSGNFSGEEWIDTVTLAPGLVISQQSIGVANSSNGFDGYDGILGVGPVDLTSVSVSNTNSVPTVSDNLFSQGTISEEVLGVYYVPFSDSSTGQLTFGGYDDSVITSSVNYVPLTTTFPSSYFWGIDQSITYGSDTVLASTAGVVDTGTTLILIATGECRVEIECRATRRSCLMSGFTDAFQTYQSKTGSTLDSATGMLSITSTQYSNLQSLTFNIGGNSYDLTPNGQIWPRSLNVAVGGSSTSIYLIVGDIGTPSGSGLDFINGYAFLYVCVHFFCDRDVLYSPPFSERYYSIYDTTNGQVGFASTAYTKSTSN